MGWTGCLGVIVRIVVLITLTSLCVYLLIKWLSCKSFWTSRIKFKQWLDLYYLSPKNWRLEDTPNRYIYGASKGYKYSYGDGYWVYIHFSFFDYLRYRLWKIGTKRRENNSKRDIRLKDVSESAQSDIERLKAQAEKRKKKVRSNAKLQLLLRAAQTDIEKLRAQSERELAEAKARTEQVRNQLGGEK